VLHYLLFFVIVCAASLVIVPFLFESYTFHLYAIGEPAFFVFSGARLWFFLASELAIGFSLGRTSRLPIHVAAGCIAIAISILTLLLYYACDPRQCYYSGPEGIGWLRLGTLLFSTAAMGLLFGSRSRKDPAGEKSINAVLFGTVTVVFLGYYPTALLLGTFMTYEMGLAILAFASTVPFLLAGLISSVFSAKKNNAAYSAIMGLAVLFMLFASLRPSGIPLLAAMLPGVAAALLGWRISRVVPRAKEKLARAIVFMPIFALFALAGAHVYMDAPMNLSVEQAHGAIIQPTYYARAYHDEKYFPTKRVEVEVDLARFDSSMVKNNNNNDFALAGIGAQSPNCCKDGLDYGYRADVLFTGSGRYLVARAWETCDQNIGCSGLPWISVMHESKVPLPANYSSVMLAMEWDGRIVNWYYKASGNNWSNYSSFEPPKIENPYFNLGVIWVGNPFTNTGSSEAYFYQAGVSTSNQAANYGQVTFHCPAYYDIQGEKHCVTAAAIDGGSSYWKVLWKWGLPNNNARVSVDGTNVTVTLG
jgi:hypothetical protein